MSSQAVVQTHPNPWRKGALFALAGFAVFALHDAMIKSLSGYSVIQIAFFAVLFSYVPFTVSLAADSQQRNLRPANPGWVMLRSACTAGGMGLAFFAFQSLPLAQAYALLFATPLVITALSIPLLGETVRLFRWVTIAIGSAGVLIALNPGSASLQAGHWCGLGAACCSALSAVATRRLGHTERSATLILYPLLTIVTGTGVLLAFVYQPMPFADLARMAVIGALAISGQFLIISAYRSASATVIAPFQYSQMIWAVLYGYLWFGETPHWNVFAGAALIIVSGLVIVWRESREGVSDNQPTLRTRNLRPLSAAPMRAVESDESEGFVDASLEASATGGLTALDDLR